MMMALSGLGFATPWLLLAVLTLPILWWLLRVTPPGPRRQVFPAIRLLLGLEAREDSPAHTPWWILALRVLVALLVILAAAGPVFNPQGGGDTDDDPLVLVIDDGWAAARDWDQRRAALGRILAEAERKARPVMVLTTAAPNDGGRPEPARMMPAAQARAVVQALEPKPWPVNRSAAVAAVKAIARDRVISAIWVTDGLEDGNGRALAAALQSLGGGLDMVQGSSGRVLVPSAAQSGPDTIAVTVQRRGENAPEERLAIRSMDGNGRILARQDATLQAGRSQIDVAVRLPLELRNRIARLDIEDETSAAAVALLDASWRRRPVGLVGSGGDGAPLLAEMYYVDRALEPFADIHRGEASELVDAGMAVMILADVPALFGSTADRLDRWVENGGVLVRFAGPLMAQAAGNSAGTTDSLLPVRLRDGGRSLGGAMSWTAPQHLAAFPQESPFAGLTVAPDIQVNTQVLADPTPDLADHSWARLSDGTPLVTGARRGKGWVVLIHTSANAAWSNLALSGLFVDMLRRLVDLAEGSAPPRTDLPLAPSQVLDGFGRLQPPTPAAIALTPPIDTVIPGPRHPPGLYGGAAGRVTLNLGPHVGKLVPLTPPPGVRVLPLTGHGSEIDLRPPLWLAALILAMLDFLITLILRGVVGRGAVVGLAATLFLAAPQPGQAADVGQFALDAALATRLAYVRTGDSAIDAKSRAGLTGLSRIIGQRSTAQLAPPMAVTLDTDPVLFFPLLYWPVTDDQKPLSGGAVEKLNAYMRAGGMIVIDTGARAESVGMGDSRALRAATQGLAIPALIPVAPDHVLTRTFYLLKEMPGRFEGPVWVADGQGAGNDGVAPVVVGGNDWAGAWAVDDSGRAPYAVTPGGERQREQAIRFGVNVVMYAMTGNYKADQVHLPAILERLGR